MAEHVLIKYEEETARVTKPRPEDVIGFCSYANCKHREVFASLPHVKVYAELNQRGHYEHLLRIYHFNCWTEIVKQTSLDITTKRTNIPTW